MSEINLTLSPIEDYLQNFAPRGISVVEYDQKRQLAELNLISVAVEAFRSETIAFAQSFVKVKVLPAFLSRVNRGNENPLRVSKWGFTEEMSPVLFPSIIEKYPKNYLDFVSSVVAEECRKFFGVSPDIIVTGKFVSPSPPIVGIFIEVIF